MPKKRTDRLCVDLRLCVSNATSDKIEKYQAKRRIEGVKLTKVAAAEELIEQLMEHYSYSYLK